jgi:hypothetical protein
MRRLLPILVVCGLAALAAVALAQVESGPALRLTAAAASGSFEVTNSRDGQPIFAATGIAPGGSASGTVKIENTGTETAKLTLHRGALVDAPGLGGGILSDRLELSVVDVGTPSAPRTVYAGPLASMPDQHAGELQPGQARTYEFTATLPDSGGTDFQNEVQSASTTVAYAWTAEEVGEGEEEEKEKEEGGGEEESGGGEEGGGGGGGEKPGGGGNPGGGSPGGGGGPSDDGSTDNGGAGGVAGQDAALDLTVPMVQRALRRGRLVVWTNCDETCRVTVRGRLRATAHGRHRGARIRLTQKAFAPPGPQRLRIPVPRKLRYWLRTQPPPKRLRAKLRFVAVGTQGQRDAARKTVKLRVRRH